MRTPRVAGAALSLVVAGIGLSACNGTTGTNSAGGSPSTSTSAGAAGSASGGAGSPVCTDVDAVKATLASMQKAKIGQGGLSTLTTDLTGLKTQVRQLGSDATAQYAPQVDAVKSRASAVSASITAATNNPSVTTLSKVRTDLTALRSAVSTLGTTVAGSC